MSRMQPIARMQLAAHASDVSPVRCASFSSFFLLYPSVFNLKEVAAVERPRLHLWETGVIRITRHPQMVGQLLWSAAHLSMVGSSFTALTMALLVGRRALAALWAAAGGATPTDRAPCAAPPL